MSTTVRPFLMFEGQADAAMQLYVSVVPGTLAAVQDSLVQSVLSEDLHGFLHLPVKMEAGENVFLFQHGRGAQPAQSL